MNDTQAAPAKKAAASKVQVASCFITGCKEQGIHDIEATVPGGVAIDVKVCEDHYTSLQEAQTEKKGKGYGVCHICKQPVGVVTQEQLISDPNVSRNDEVIVSWWRHAESDTLCHENCTCIEKIASGYTRMSALVSIR